MLQEEGESFVVVAKGQVAENAADYITVVFSTPVGFARALDGKVEEEVSKHIFV